MKTILNIFNSTFRVLIGIIILGLLLGGIVLLIWGSPGKSYNLTEKYLTIGDYSIGKQQYYHNICNKEKGCLNGEILGLKQNNTDIYIYIKVNHGTGYNGIDNEKSKFYNYYFYNRINYLTIYDLKDLPKYAYLLNNKLEFYSEKDLENLPKEQQKIFKDLEENPTVIIDGVDYTKE